MTLNNVPSSKASRMQAALKSIWGGKYDPDGTLLITFDTKLSPIDIKEVRHQIALAVQGYFNTANRKLSR